MMGVTKALQALLIWASPVAAALATAAEVQPRSTNLATVLETLESDIPTCAYQCFSVDASSRSCEKVDNFLTDSVSSCLYSNCTTHERIDAEKQITSTCGTEVRSTQSHVRAIAWTLWSVATIFLSGRLIARSTLAGFQLGYDDWTILLSYVVLTAVTIGAELMVVFGLGTDMWTLDDLHINIVLILFYIAEFAYVIESTITKVSILFLYLRIFPDKAFRKHCFILMTIMGLFCLAFVVTLLTYCIPFEYTWTRWDNENHGKCIDMNAQTYTCAGLNIVLDLTIFFLPLRQLTHLDLSMKKKIGIICTFLVGLFVTICSAIRLRALIGWNKSTNPTMDYANLAAWSLVELDVGVICACMPGMAGLFRRLKKQSSDYIRSRPSQNSSQMLGGSQSAGQAITKTTMISVQRTNGANDDGMSESELELVDRSKYSESGYNFPGYARGV